MEKISISIGSDHAGFILKTELINHLTKDREFDIDDCGTIDENTSVDYPDFGHLVAYQIQHGFTDFGILICGSGIGMSIAANRHPNVRCALCWSKPIAELARQHNNANILALPARFLTEIEAVDIIDVFFNTTFQGGKHTERIEKIEIP